jgi:hypothetical protein
LERYPGVISPATEIGNFNGTILMPYAKFLTISEDDIHEEKEIPLQYEDLMLEMGQNLKFKALKPRNIVSF